MRNPGRICFRLDIWALAIVLVATCGIASARGESCTTQSAMAEADRDGLAGAARGMAEKVLANDAAGLRALMIPEYAKDATAIQSAVGNAAAKVKGATLVVEQIYLLDASDMKRAADGSAPNAQFSCTLNKSINAVDFSISGLPPGKYGF